MFEHNQLDGNKYRLLESEKAYINEAILEYRDPKNGQSVSTSGRHQHAVIGGVLVERFLPPETIGEQWSHETQPAWWEVVGHPPHAGIVADFNQAMGGEYLRTLNPTDNIVAYGPDGEPVLMDGAQYRMVRASDEGELVASSLLEIRKSY